MLGLDVIVMIPRKEMDSNKTCGKIPLEGNDDSSVTEKQERDC